METDCDESNLTTSNNSLSNIKNNQNTSDGELDDLSGEDEDDDIDLDPDTESLSTNSPANLAPTSVERLPVGANPRDKNNPLSVNQLTGDFLPKQLYQNYATAVAAAAASSTSSFYHHNQPITSASSTQFYEASPPKERKNDGGAISVT